MPIHRHGVFPAESLGEGGPASPCIGLFEFAFFHNRAIAHLLCSGVFERYPSLTFVSTESIDGAVIPGYLAELDKGYLNAIRGTSVGTHFNMGAAANLLKKKPSEYFETNCYVAGPLDLPEAIVSGTPNLMFGADIPHSEGTGSFTREAVRRVAPLLDDGDFDELLSLRAARVYDFDLTQLQLVADRIGPTKKQLRAQLNEADWPKYPEATLCRIFSNV